MQSLDKQAVMRVLEHEFPLLRERYGVVRLALYGSFAHGTPTDESDVDLLVGLSRPLGLEFVALAEHLEDRLGRKVDLTTFGTLDRNLGDPRRNPIARRIQGTLVDVRPAA
jgi:predicted nucleotidyltransferase